MGHQHRWQRAPDQQLARAADGGEHATEYAVSLWVLSRIGVTGPERRRNAAVAAEQEDYGARAGRLARDQRCKNASGIFHGRRFPSAPDRQRLRGAELGQGPKHDNESGGTPRRPADRRMVAESRRFSIDERKTRQFYRHQNTAPT